MNFKTKTNRAILHFHREIFVRPEAKAYRLYTLWRRRIL